MPDRHISFEVFSDDIPEMVAQARVITAWGKNVYVKLPVTTTRNEPLFDVVRALSRDGVKINMTAIFTPEQVADARSRRSTAARRPACRYSPGVSRISASTIGRSCKTPSRARARRAISRSSGPLRAKCSTWWKRTAIGCHIITAPADVLKKLPALGTKSAAELSLGAVKSFREDALAAACSCTVPASRAAE